MCMLGTFSTHTVVNENSVVKIDEDIPLDKAALVGCGVTTGFGTAVYGAKVGAGDTVVVMGIGGVGANAVQGARVAGASVTFEPFSRTHGGGHIAVESGSRWSVVRRLSSLCRQSPFHATWPYK